MVAPVKAGIVFRLACIPPKTSHHAKHIVRLKTKEGRQFSTLADNAPLVAAKALLEELLLPHQPASPIAGAVALSLEFTWPWSSDHRKRDRALGRMVHTGHVDLTNVTKTIEDRLKVLRFIEDDCFVVELHVRKWWGAEPGIVVAIAPAGSPQSWAAPSVSAPSLFEAR